MHGGGLPVAGSVTVPNERATHRVTTRGPHASARPTGDAGPGRSSRDRPRGSPRARRHRARTTCRRHPVAAGHFGSALTAPPPPTLGSGARPPQGLSAGVASAHLASWTTTPCTTSQSPTPSRSRSITRSRCRSIPRRTRRARRPCARDAARRGSGPRGTSTSRRTITRTIPSTRPDLAVGGLEHRGHCGGDDRPALDHGSDERGARRVRRSCRSRGSPASRGRRGRGGPCAPRRTTRRTRAARPRTIWSRPAEEMVLEESCCWLPPARNTVSSGDHAGAQHPAGDEAPRVATPAAHAGWRCRRRSRAARSRRAGRSRRRRARLSMAARRPRVGRRASAVRAARRSAGRAAPPRPGRPRGVRRAAGPPRPAR